MISFQQEKDYFRHVIDGYMKAEKLVNGHICAIPIPGCVGYGTVIQTMRNLVSDNYEVELLDRMLLIGLNKVEKPQMINLADFLKELEKLL